MQLTAIKKNLCTGCGACVMKCPRQAIVFMDDAEGFPYPVIDQEKCVDCGICENVCPAAYPPSMHEVREAYAVQHSDKEVLKKSTSGGMFTALAKEILDREGIVYGCVWDKEYNAVLAKAETEKELAPIRGSKYVWSAAARTYPEIKQYLQEGREVLFTGLACQVAGLRKYLGTDYDNLYTVDLLCGGAPSPKAFKLYIDTLTKSVPIEELGLLFRDKSKYGVGVHVTYQSRKGRTGQRVEFNSYFYAYMLKLMHRKACFKCPYATEHRAADITIADYWGIHHYHTEFDIRSGVSAVLINSPKAQNLMKRTEPQVQLSKSRMEDITGENNLFINGTQPAYTCPPYRDEFFKVLMSKGWKAAERKYLWSLHRIKVLVWRKYPNLFSKLKRLLKGK